MVNTDAWALVAEPNVQPKYFQMKPRGKWYYWSSAHHLYGQGWGEAHRGQVGNPEGWYCVNALTKRSTTPKTGAVQCSICFHEF
ncbi:Solitary outer membrane autotransporter beta-barrel domain [Vibrio vulnificus]|uniref:Solitary outer membrane autotransporter beta-barrel domain n=1 Tax=Vibrio vulnificus TaxID=672 RepID=UPI001EEB6357|nr:Solitary outer membrane autotransporter beta-barrel domain [Vibrio vulnificus]MCG6295836.1 Solitary outer membrane autotransporter beta-barrel domain [Vibrio vulnificus]